MVLVYMYVCLALVMLLFVLGTIVGVSLRAFLLCFFFFFFQLIPE